MMRWVSGRPTGALTFLFTDVEGSTKVWEAHPADMEVALAVHDELLETAIRAAGGYIFTRAGDSFAAAFPRADHDLNAAEDLQHRLGHRVLTVAAVVGPLCRRALRRRMARSSRLSAALPRRRARSRRRGRCGRC